MKNEMKKRILALGLILCMTESLFAAAVSDNDGASFITRAEFDSMKNDFQVVLDSYNSGIDRKIDGLIASYLSSVKESKTDKLALDEKSQYLFPLVMCGPNNEWNDYDKTEYYDLSIPHCDNYTVSTSAARSTSDSGTQATVHQRSYLSLPVSVPVVSSAHLGYGKTCRILHNLNAFQYSGQFGTLNTLRKTSFSRKINGTNRTLFELIERGKGRYNIYVRSHGGVSIFWDGNAENNSTPRWNYPLFVGLSRTNFKNESGINKLLWNVASGVKPAVRTWTKSSGMYGASYMNSNKDFYFNLDGVSNIEEALTICNNVASPTFSGYDSDQGALFANPFLCLPEWSHTNGTNTCYFGTANMQGNLRDGYWNFTPVVGTSAATQKVAEVTNRQDMANSYYVAYNFSDTDFSSYSGVLSNMPTCFPYWQATENTSWSEQTSNDFSQLRASIVYYTDSNGDTHYLDEGMYLGKYNRNNAEVTFTVKFTDADNWSIDLALSKKPFGYDAVASDKVSYTYKDVTTSTSGTENTCAAGSSARMQCNKSWKITVRNINRGDKLYMQWQPATSGHYVALDSFKDYEITGT